MIYFTIAAAAILGCVVYVLIQVQNEKAERKKQNEEIVKLRMVIGIRETPYITGYGMDGVPNVHDMTKAINDIWKDVERLKKKAETLERARLDSAITKKRKDELLKMKGNMDGLSSDEKDWLAGTIKVDVVGPIVTQGKAMTKGAVMYSGTLTPDMIRDTQETWVGGIRYV